MKNFPEFNIAGSGLHAQRSRIRAALSNLVNARTTKPGGARPDAPFAVVLRSLPDPTGAAGVEGVQAETVRRPGAQPRVVYEPDHPDANARGMVAYPDIDPMSEMVDLMNASRSYEAALNAFDLSRDTISATLEIGR